MTWLTTNRGRDLASLGLIALLVLILLWPVTIGGKLLLPADMLMVMQPWKEHAREVGFERVHTPFLDSIQQHYPWRKFAAEQMKQGTIPLWNPYMFCGSPFVANNQSACFYPETWLFMLMAPERAFGWAALLSLLMGGGFMFAFLRTLGLRRLSAVVGVIPFLFCGFLIGWMLLPTVRAVPMWLPLMLLAFEKTLRACGARACAAPDVSPLEGPVTTRPAVRDVSPEPTDEPLPRPAAGRVLLGPSNGHGSRFGAMLWSALGALAIGMQFLAGHLHVSFFVLLIFAAYVVFRLVQTVRAGERRAALCGLVHTVVGGLTGVLLAMLQLLPVLELVGMNTRKAGADFATAKANAMIPSYLLAALMPDAFGNPADYNFWGAMLFKGNREYIETVWYMGVPTLLLIVAALAWRKTRTPGLSAAGSGEQGQTWLWTGMWLGGAALAWGTVVYWVLFALVPPLRQLTGISRAVLICDFSAAVLAAYGFEALTRRLQAGDPGMVRRLIDRAAMVLGLIAIAGGAGLWLYSGRLEDALPGIGNYTLVQLLRCLGLILSSVAAVAVMTWTVASSSAEGTALAVPKRARGAAQTAPSERREERLPTARVVWGRALLVAVLAVDLLYFAHHFLPATPARFLHVKSEALDRLREDTSLYRMTSLVGEGKGIDRMPPNLTMAFGFQDVQGSDSLVFDGYQKLIDLVPHDAKGNPDPASPLLDLLNCRYLLTSLDLKDTPGWKLLTSYETNVYENTQALPRAFVAARVEQASPEQALAKMKTGFDPVAVTYLNAPAKGAGGTLTVSNYQPNRVSLAGQVPTGAAAVLGDVWYPGWHAYADGVETPLRRANYILRAVTPTQATKRIDFVYYPASFAAGAFLTCLAVMLIACGLTLGWRRR